MTDGNTRNRAVREGTVVSVRGSIVDVVFGEGLPEIFNLLKTGDDGEIRREVLSHLNARTVRGIALTPTHGLARGARTVDTGGPLSVPVGRELLGRMFNVFGEVIDGAGELKSTEVRSIHQKPIPLARQSVPQQFRPTV